MFHCPIGLVGEEDRAARQAQAEAQARAPSWSDGLLGRLHAYWADKYGAPGTIDLTVRLVVTPKAPALLRVSSRETVAPEP